MCARCSGVKCSFVVVVMDGKYGTVVPGGLLGESKIERGRFERGILLVEDVGDGLGLAAVSVVKSLVYDCRAHGTMGIVYVLFVQVP